MTAEMKANAALINMKAISGSVPAPIIIKASESEVIE
jgi:hypothetical protein